MKISRLKPRGNLAAYLHWLKWRWCWKPITAISLCLFVMHGLCVTQIGPHMAHWHFVVRS